MHQRSWILASIFFLFAFLLFLSSPTPLAFAGGITLSWDLNTDSDLKGYNLYIGTQSGIYDSPNSPTFIDKAFNSTLVTNLTEGTTYYFALTAVDYSGNESEPSDEVSKDIPVPGPDTLAPTVTLTAPTHGATVAGFVTVTAAASDNVGVLGVQFQLDGANLGPEDTTNDYQVVWDTSTLALGTYTLTAIARDAAGNTTTTAPITVTVTDSPTAPLKISNLTVTSGRAYQVIPNGLQPGAKGYIDRAYTYKTIPTTLNNVTYLQTANDDKNSSGPSFLSFDVNQSVTVYVAHDIRITPKPAWLAAFLPTGEALVTTDTTLNLFSRSFSTGTITLGGNHETTSGLSMYTVAVVGQGGAVIDTTPPSAPTIEQALANSASQTTVTWTAATDDVGVTAYTLYRNGTAIGTTPTLSYVDTGLAAAMTYAYTVTALDAAGNESSPSTAVSATTPALLDTQAPTVTLTAPANGATVAGSVIVAAAASDNVGVLGVQFQLDGANLGAEDTTNDYQVVWDTSTFPLGTYTLTAIARDAAGNATTSVPISVTVTDSPLPLKISNVTVTSGRTYQVIPNGLQPGAALYIDRAYTYTTVPTTLANATYLQTANNDKSSTGASFLSFEVNQPVTVYVAHDTGITPKPAWLATFTPTGEALVTTNTPSDLFLDLFSRSFPAGPITLGGNHETTSGRSMYTVAVVGQGGTAADSIPPSTPTIQQALASSSTQATVTWTAATDDVGVTAYTLYRDGIAIGTTPTLSYVDTGLAAGTTYAYTVTALDAAGNESAPSAAVSVTTLVLPDTTPPSTPTIPQTPDTGSWNRGCR